jgi:quercetin dioxygenase-like cupin family protein
MAAVVHRAREGEALFDGRIVIKVAFDELTVTESWFATARPGAGPHFHRHHADSFYVLDGELGFLVGSEEHLLGAGACVCVPPEVVHAFWSTSPARFLNLHTPDAGFADNLRAIDRGDPGGFDSVDAGDGTARPSRGATLAHAGRGERRAGRHSVVTKIEHPELSLVELELEPGFERRELGARDGRVLAYYVLDGEIELGAEESLLGAGSFVAVPPGTAHTVSSSSARSRLLRIQAPAASRAAPEAHRSGTGCCER